MTDHCRISAAVDELGKHGLSGNSVLGMFTCNNPKCRCVVDPDEKKFKAHLRKDQHGRMKAIEYNKLWKLACDVMQTFPAQHVDRAKYLTGGLNMGKLPVIDGLDVFNVRACSHCDKLFRTYVPWYRHVKSQHNDIELKRQVWNAQPEMLGQALSHKAGNERFFLVCQGTVAENEDQLTHNLKVYDPNYVSEMDRRADSRREKEREKSGFLRVSRADERLRALGLSLEEALKLTSFPMKEREPRLFGLASLIHRATVNLYKDAQELFWGATSFSSLLMDIATSGTQGKNKPFRFLPNDSTGDSTKERYARNARIIVFMACRVYFEKEMYCGVRMSEQIESQVRSLLECNDRDIVKFQECVHNLYIEVFMEQVIGVTGANGLFASALTAALCVGKGERGNPRFRIGLDVSHPMASILYTASCCAILEIYKYSNIEDINAKLVREKEVINALAFGAKTGVAVFCDMRSICAKLRDEETNAPMYSVCEKHRKCGIFKGIEYSVLQLGEAVRCMQQDVKDTLFSVLLCGSDLPNGYVKELQKLSENEMKMEEGYWFLGDRRNEEFLKRSIEWLNKNVVAKISGGRKMKQWLKSAKSVHERLLCLLHLTGGGPGRGTEIASMAIRNTKNRRRAVFFVGEEVMVFPTHNKTSALRNGRMRIVYRFLDKKTSYLWKIFFALVHPILVLLPWQEREPLWSGVRSSEEEQRSRGGSIRNNLCLGATVEYRVTEVLGSWFAKYGIPFKFGDYRHWQRGYVKASGCMKLAERLVNLETVSPDDEELAGMDADVVAAIEQGGHSVRTAFNAYAGLEGCEGSRGSRLVAESWKKLQRAASMEWHRELGLRQENRMDRLECSATTWDASCRSVEVGDEAIERIAREVSKKLESVFSTSAIKKGTNIGEREVSYEEVRNEEDEETISTKCNPEKNAICPGYTSLEALRNVLKDVTVTFRSPLQEEAMQAVHARRTDLALVLSTGFGKTAIVCGPILYENGCTIWVSPLKALLRETRLRLKYSGMNIFSGEEEQLETMGSDIGNVVLLSPEAVSRFEIMERIKRLGRDGKVNRIVIDEAHIPFMSRGYRECMSALCGLEDVGEDVQRVLVTATAPPHLLPAICRTCGVEPAGIEVIRGDPCRPNLKLKVEILPNGRKETLSRRVVGNVKSFLLRRRSAGAGACTRVLCICLTIGHADEIHAAFSRNKDNNMMVCKYHASMSTEDIKSSVAAWEGGTERGVIVMVATDGFSTGTDVPNIRLVVFAGGSRSLIDFWQGAGRGGRDGGAATVNVLYHDAFMIGSMGDRDSVFGNRKALGDFMLWAKSAKTCRRHRIEEFLGGLESNVTCRERIGATPDILLCDVCEKLEKRSSFLTNHTKMPTQVVVHKRSALSDLEVSKFKRQRTFRMLDRAKELDSMRSLGRKLKTVCVACLVEIRSACTDKSNVQKARDDMRRAQMCDQRTCSIMRQRCLRCQQRGHRVQLCNTMSSTRNREAGVCHVCFFGTVEGRTVHISSEFGNKKGCPYEVLTRFVLMCYSCISIRAEMVNEFEELIGMKESEVADWLLKDEIALGRPARIFKATSWAMKFLGVEVQ